MLVIKTRCDGPDLTHVLKREKYRNFSRPKIICMMTLFVLKSQGSPTFSRRVAKWRPRPHKEGCQQNVSRNYCVLGCWICFGVFYWFRTFCSKYIYTEYFNILSGCRFWMFRYCVLCITRVCLGRESENSALEKLLNLTSRSKKILLSLIMNWKAFI